MKIKTRLMINTTISVCIAFVIGTVISLAAYKVYQETQQEKIINDVVKEVNKLEVLTYEYFLHHEEMVSSQWKSKQQSITQTLMSIESKTLLHAKNTLMNMKVSLENIKMNFNQLILSFEKRVELDQEHAALSRKYEERLGGQLMTSLNGLFYDSLQLSQKQRAKIDTTKTRTMWFIIIFTIIMVCSTGVLSLAIGKSIFGPIVKLQKGVDIISNGNLDYKVNLSIKSEIGKLAQSFNTMVENLRKSQESLRKRTDELERSNKELNDFAYVVSHDLKAPLRAIHNYADFLQKDLKGNLEEEQEMYLEGMGNAVIQSETYLDDVLELLQVGKHKITFKDINIETYLQELITSLDLSSDVEVILQDDWPSMQVEPTLLKQIFQNLIINGIKFNQSSQKTIEIGWQQIDNEHYEFFVKDNGIGIEQRFFKKIFSPFQRLHTSEEYEGSGIGLATVEKAVNRLEWTVRVESTPGEGSAFFISIPKAGSDGDSGQLAVKRRVDLNNI